jgi:hypothetical protein
LLRQELTAEKNSSQQQNFSFHFLKKFVVTAFGNKEIEIQKR